MEFLKWILKTLGRMHIKLPGVKIDEEDDYLFPTNTPPESPQKKEKNNSKIKAIVVATLASIVVIILVVELVFIPLAARSQAREGEALLAAAEKDTLQYTSEKNGLSEEEKANRQFSLAYEYRSAASVLGGFNSSYATRFISLGEKTVIGWGQAEVALGYTQRALKQVEGFFMQYNKKITQKDMFYYYLARWYRTVNQSTSAHYVELAKQVNPPTLYSAATILENAASNSRIDDRISALNTVLQTYQNFPQIVIRAEVALGDAYATKGYSEPNFFEKAVEIYNQAIENIKQEQKAPVAEVNEQTINVMEKVIGVYRLEMAFTPSVKDEAVQACDNAISLASGSKSVESIYFEKAAIYFDAGDWANAIEAFTSANTLFPNSPYEQKALWSIGEAYANLGKNEISVSYLTMAIAINTEGANVPDIMLDLGKNLEQSHQYAKAINVYKTILNRNDANKYVETEADRRLKSLNALYGGG